MKIPLILSILIVLTASLVTQTENKNQSPGLNPLIGEWVHDLDTLKKYYDMSELAKATYKTWEDAKKEVLSGTGGRDIVFSQDTLTHMRDGRKTVSYPYTLIRAEGEWVEIEYTHFLGGKRRMLFKIEGNVLLDYYTNAPRVWHPLRVYVKKVANKN